MFGVDDGLGQMAEGHALAVALGITLVLGLRHTTDPDHLVAVSTLVASESEGDTRRAGRLGLARAGTRLDAAGLRAGR